MIAAVSREVWLLLCMQSPAVLLFLGGLLGIATLFAVSRAIALYRLLAGQRDREAQILREVTAAAEALEVGSHG